jgi:ABC-type glycerol-3-phosphate transport system substrate-binding protein
MEDSGLFNEKFLRVMKPDVVKMWATMKEYFKTEYDGIKMVGNPNPRRMETINNVMQAKAQPPFDVMQLLGMNRYSKWRHHSKKLLTQ